MKIKAKKLLCEDSKDKFYHECKVDKFCCERMKWAVDKRFIAIKEERDGFQKKFTYLPGAYLTEWEYGSFMLINLCPFCGEKIEVIMI